MTLKRFFSPLNNERSFQHGLWIVLILALVLRLPVVLAIAHEPERAVTGSDAEQYLALANNLIDEGVFSRESDPPYTPEVFRTPGYPAFLLPFVLIFGERPLLPVVIGQVILSVLTVWGTIQLAHRLFDEQIGLWAGALLAVMPITILMTGAIYAETVFAALLVGAGWLLIDSLERDRWLLSAAAGLVLGIATLVRPIGLPMIALWAILPLAKRPIRRALPHILALLIAFALPVGAWMGRNATLSGRFSLASVSDSNLLYYNVASSEAHRLGIPLDEARAMLYDQVEALPPTGDDWPSSAEGTVARRVIVEHPAAFVWYNGVDALNGLRPGFSRLLMLVGTADDSADVIEIFREGSFRAVWRAVIGQGGLLLIVEVLMVLAIAILIVGSVVGFVVMLTRRRWFEVVLLGLIPALLLYLPGLASNARFRAPVEPLLAILAAGGAILLVRQAMKSTGRRIAVTSSKKVVGKVVGKLHGKPGSKK
ncbi:MAG: glycosyltransferase family 39 protein [Anaerolineae bacterium]|nr:glycosyltransferase family 39 protein [Anaerolineae bacterium]